MGVAGRHRRDDQPVLAPDRLGHPLGLQGHAGLHTGDLVWYLLGGCADNIQDSRRDRRRDEECRQRGEHREWSGLRHKGEGITIKNDIFIYSAGKFVSQWGNTTTYGTTKNNRINQATIGNFTPTKVEIAATHERTAGGATTATGAVETYVTFTATTSKRTHKKAAINTATVTEATSGTRTSRPTPRRPRHRWPGSSVSATSTTSVTPRCPATTPASFWWFRQPERGADHNPDKGCGHQESPVRR